MSTTQQMLDYLRDQYLHEQDRAIAAEQRAYKLANEVERLNYLQRRSAVKEHQAWRAFQGGFLSGVIAGLTAAYILVHIAQ